MRTISLLLRDEWGGLQRVLGMLTKKRVRIESVMCGRSEFEGHSRLFIVSDDERLPRMLDHLRKLQDVVEAELVESPARGFSLVRTLEERMPWPRTMDLATARALATGDKIAIMEKGV